MKKLDYNNLFYINDEFRSLSYNYEYSLNHYYNTNQKLRLNIKKDIYTINKIKKNNIYNITINKNSNIIFNVDHILIEFDYNNYLPVTYKINDITYKFDQIIFEKHIKFYKYDNIEIIFKRKNINIKKMKATQKIIWCKKF
jgi:hypothetical protein